MALLSGLMNVMEAHMALPCCRMTCCWNLKNFLWFPSQLGVIPLVWYSSIQILSWVWSCPHVMMDQDMAPVVRVGWLGPMVSDVQASAGLLATGWLKLHQQGWIHLACYKEGWLGLVSEHWVEDQPWLNYGRHGRWRVCLCSELLRLESHQGWWCWFAVTPVGESLLLVLECKGDWPHEQWHHYWLKWSELRPDERHCPRMLWPH